MEAHMQSAAAVRQTCIAAALQASDEAGISGLGHEGYWDSAVEALRRLPLRLLVPVGVCSGYVSKPVTAIPLLTASEYAARYAPRPTG